MGSISGSKIRLKYGEEGEARRVNEIRHDKHTVGILEGGELTRVSGQNEVTIAPFRAYLGDDAGDLTVLASTEADYTMSVSQSAPYLVLTYNWYDTENQTVTVQGTADPSSVPNSVILGKCIWLTGDLQSTFDYTEKQWSILKKLKDVNMEGFRVTAVETSAGVYADYVQVGAGKFVTQKYDDTVIQEIDTPTNTNSMTPILNNYYYRGIVFIDFDGNTYLQDAIDNTDYPNTISANYSVPIAEIRYHNTTGNTVSYITGDMITQLDDTYRKEFVGCALNLWADNKIAVNQNTSFEVQKGGIVLNGETTTGKLISVKGTDNSEQVSVSGNGQIDTKGSIVTDGIGARSGTAVEKGGVDILADVTPDSSERGFAVLDSSQTGLLEVRGDGVYGRGGGAVDMPNGINIGGGDVKEMVISLPDSAWNNDIVTYSHGLTMDRVLSVTFSYNTDTGGRACVSDYLEENGTRQIETTPTGFEVDWSKFKNDLATGKQTKVFIKYLAN